jgi:hypothetical protein
MVILFPFSVNIVRYCDIDTLPVIRPQRPLINDFFSFLFL